MGNLSHNGNQRKQIMAPDNEIIPANTGGLPAKPGDDKYAFEDVRGNLEDAFKGARSAIKQTIQTLASDLSQDAQEAKAIHGEALAWVEEAYDLVRRGKMSLTNYFQSMRRIGERLVIRLGTLKNKIIKRQTAMFLSGIFTMLLGAAGKFASVGLDAVMGGLDRLAQSIG